MKKASKIISLSLSVLLAAGALFSTGCAKKTETKPADTGSKAQETSASKIDISKPVTLKYYLNQGLTPVQANFKDLPLIQEAFAKYLKDKVNATVEFNFIPGSQYTSKMNMMFAANEDVDIAWQNSPDYWSNVAKGAYTDITGMMDTYAPKTKALLKGPDLEGSKYKGKNYGIMSLKELTYPLGFHIRGDLAEKYNLSYKNIKKLEEIEPLLSVIKEKEPSVTWPISWGGTSILYEDDYDTVVSDLVGISYKTGKASLIYEDQKVADGFKLFHKWYEKGYINKDLALGKNVAQDSGQNFIYIRSLAPLATNLLNPAFKWDEVPMTGMKITTGRVSSQMTVIPKASKNPERALMLIEVMNTDPAAKNLVLYGIEGTHYTKIKDKPVVIDFAPGLNRQNSPWYPQSSNISVNLGNFLNDYLMKGEPENRAEYYVEWNKKCESSPYLGFNFDTQNVLNEIGACNNVKSQYLPLFNGGAVDVDTELPKYKQKLKEAGIEKIQAEVQKQLDAFMAEKKK